MFRETSVIASSELSSFSTSIVSGLQKSNFLQRQSVYLGTFYSGNTAHTLFSS